MKNIFYCYCWFKRYLIQYFYSPDIETRDGYLPYTVQREDTVSSLAKKLRMSEEEITDLAGEKGFGKFNYQHNNGIVEEIKYLHNGITLWIKV